VKSPLGPEADRFLDEQFKRLAQDLPIESTSLTVDGRRLDVPSSVVGKGIAKFSFHDLCEKVNTILFFKTLINLSHASLQN
jgi:predicted ATPase